MSLTKKLEIDHRTIKLLVGLIALGLANATSFFSEHTITSISESYHYGAWPRDILVGSLFAISALMFAYNGFSTREMVLTKLAALAALGVAMFPCECGTHDPVIPRVHGISAGVMFLILAELCRIFYLRAKEKRYANADRRAFLYVGCGIGILLSIAILAVDHALGGAFVERAPRLVFYCERLGLIAFGIAWLAASHILPGFTDPHERWFRS